MPNSKIIEVTLTPVGKFFFGGEIVFGGGENAQDSRRRSYLVNSNVLPQQTSLLGMLREALLRQNGLLKPWRNDTNPGPSGKVKTAAEKKQMAIDAVGATGFQIGSSSAKSGFGIIEELSPLVIVDSDGTIHQPVPLDDDVHLGDKGVEHNLAWAGKEKADSPLKLENFREKKGLSLRFAPEDEKSKPRKPADYFASQSQVGITVTNRNDWRTEEGDQEGFFRYSAYRNGESAFAHKVKKKKTKGIASFRFWVAVNGNHSKDIKLWQKVLVHLGGERSCFQMQVNERTDLVDLEAPFFEIPYRYNLSQPAGYDRIILLSDAFLSPTDLEQWSVYAVAKTRHFRFFTTDLNHTQRFYDFRHQPVNYSDGVFHFQRSRTGDRNGRIQSRRYTLLERGGVLLVPKSNVKAVENALINAKAFRRIGYNYFQTINY